MTDPLLGHTPHEATNREFLTFVCVIMSVVMLGSVSSVTC